MRVFITAIMVIQGLGTVSFNERLEVIDRIKFNTPFDVNKELAEVQAKLPNTVWTAERMAKYVSNVVKPTRVPLWLHRAVSVIDQSVDPRSPKFVELVRQQVPAGQEAYFYGSSVFLGHAAYMWLVFCVNAQRQFPHRLFCYSDGTDYLTLSESQFYEYLWFIKMKEHREHAKAQ